MGNNRINTDWHFHYAPLPAGYAGRGYAYLVPFIEEADYYFLKTVIPSRKATRDYLQRGGKNEKET